MAGALFAALLCVPYVLGYLHQNSEWRFTGIVRLAEDNNSYLAWSKQAAKGFLLFQVPYTTEPQPRVMFLPFFALAGGLARITRSPVCVWVNLLHLGSAIFFLWALWRWLKCMTGSTAVRHLAFVLVLFSSGFGGMVSRLSQGSQGLPDFLRFPTGSPGISGSADLWSFDFITFSNLLHYPLGPVSLALLLLSFSELTPAEGKISDRRSLTGGVASAFLWAVHPYDALMAWSLVWTAPLLNGLSVRRALRPLSIFYGVSVFPLAYVFWLLQVNPVLKAYAQNLHPFPVPLGSYFFGLGPVFVFAVAGSVLLMIQKNERRGCFALVWGLAAVGGLYLPLVFRYKWMHGVHIAFCFLAAQGLVKVVEWMKTRGRKILTWSAVAALALFFLGGSFTNFQIWREDVENVRARWLPYYLPQPFRQALRYLDENARPYDAVLTTRRLGIFVPPWTGCRTYAGHWDQTLDLERKEKEIEAVFSAAVAGDARKRFLQANGIRFLLIPLRYWADKSAAWDQDPSLRKVYENGYYRVYRVLV